MLLPEIVPKTVPLKEVLFEALADKLYVCRTYFKISEALPYSFDFSRVPKNEIERIEREMDLDEALEQIGGMGNQILKETMFLGGIVRMRISAYSLEILVEKDTSWDFIYPQFEKAVREAEKRFNKE